MHREHLGKALSHRQRPKEKKDGNPDYVDTPRRGLRSIRKKLPAAIEDRNQIDHISPLIIAISHTAQCLAGNLPTLFGEPIPPTTKPKLRYHSRSN